MMDHAMAHGISDSGQISEWLGLIQWDQFTELFPDMGSMFDRLANAGSGKVDLVARSCNSFDREVVATTRLTDNRRLQLSCIKRGNCKAMATLQLQTVINDNWVVVATMVTDKQFHNLVSPSTIQRLMKVEPYQVTPPRVIFEGRPSISTSDCVFVLDGIVSIDQETFAVVPTVDFSDSVVAMITVHTHIMTKTIAINPTTGQWWAIADNPGVTPHLEMVYAPWGVPSCTIRGLTPVNELLHLSEIDTIYIGTLLKATIQ